MFLISKRRIAAIKDAIAGAITAIGSRTRAKKTGKKFLHCWNGTINKLPLKSSCDTLHSDHFDDDVSLSALKLIIKGQESEGQGAKIPSSVAA